MPTRPKNKVKTMDYTMLAIVMGLLIFGLVALYSASTVISYTKNHTTTYYLFHQFIFGALIGLILAYVCSKIDYHIWQKYATVIVILSLGLLILVLLPHIGLKIGNSRRWIHLGSLVVQPAEIAKLAIIFYIASWIDKRQQRMKSFAAGIVPVLIVVALVSGLIILQPDIGTMLIVILISLTMLFVGGTQIRHLFFILLGGLAALAILIKLQPYRINRIIAFRDPSLDPQGIGYQINQALLAIGSGGITGVGYGNSRQKHNYLPEVIGDSIFAIIVEELGFVTAALVVGTYAWFALRGLRISRAAPDNFGRMVAVGIVAWISFQALINIGAISAILPLTGIPLPFISYGSSALILNLAAIGILLNISKHSTI